MSITDTGSPLHKNYARHMGNLIALFYVIGCLVGCDRSDRPDLGSVTGMVTLDGQPLPNAWVTFIQKGFRPSSDKTDANGRYELNYIRDIKGAALGTHTVKIELETPESAPSGIQQLPARYHVDSQMEREVKEGTNVFDFELASGE